MSKTKIFLAAGIIGLVIGLLLSGRPEKPLPPTLQQSLDRQAAMDTLYLPADLPRWRDALFHRLQPEIVITGSTQVLAFRAENFNRPFMNLGGMATLPEAISATRNLFAAALPKTLLIGVDLRWFAQPSVAGCFNITCNAAKGDGYDKNGAYHPVSLWAGKNAAAADSGFAKSGTFKAAQPHDAQLQQFDDWLQALHAQHIRVIVFMPPTASKINQDTDVKPLAAVTEAHAAAFYDERRSIPRLDDCEFSSGYEPGQILAKRLLLDMATRDSDLQALVQLPEIGWDIDHFAGRASKLPNEVDFLNLGCKKAIKPAQ